MSELPDIDLIESIIKHPAEDDNGYYLTVDQFMALQDEKKKVNAKLLINSPYMIRMNGINITLDSIICVSNFDFKFQNQRALYYGFSVIISTGIKYSIDKEVKISDSEESRNKFAENFKRDYNTYLKIINYFSGDKNGC